MFSSTQIRNLRLAFKTLLLHKLRSGLTMLGIVFGVCSVIAMLAIGEGASQQAQQQVLELGATNIIVRSVKPPDGSGTTSTGEVSRVLRYGLTETDYEILSKTLENVTGIVPVREVYHQVQFQRQSMDARIVGCTPEYVEMNHLAISRGQFFEAIHLRDQLNVVVLGSDAAEKLFPGVDPIGNQVLVSSAAYRVIGVMRPRTASAAIGGSLSAQDFNKDVYLPLSTFKSRLTSDDVFIRYVSGSFSSEKVTYNQITLKIDDSEKVVRTAEVVKETLARTHGTVEDYAVVVPLELLEQANQLRWIFNVVLGSVAAISLLVGGIGIMNIMLATVTERTREIGIRRALGARRGDIVQQFLTETVVLSGVGGAIGLLLGLLTGPTFHLIRYIVFALLLDGDGSSSEVGRIFGQMQPQIAVWSLPVAFGFSVTVGLVFGVYPAQAAARLHPIEALRHE